MGGFAVALIAWVLILRESTWSLSGKDALYWTAIFAMVLARHLDVTRFGGRDSEGGKASPADVRRYAWTVLGASVLAWALAHAVQV
jgi:hypothetical protein